MKLCACGCGQPTLQASVHGTRKGNYNKFIQGHTFRGVPKSLEHKRKLSEAKKRSPTRYWLGKKMPESAREAMRVPKGRQSPEHIAKCAALRRGQKRPQSVINELRNRQHTPESRLKRRLAQLGEKGSNWKGGISPINERIRQSSEFSQWRLLIFKRDSFTCKLCQATNGNGNHIMLIPHHIKRFADYPKLRFDINNGITLCFDCHKPTIGHEKEYEQLFQEKIRLSSALTSLLHPSLV